ncbi:Nif3-like dinuclear metal center hexameric protein [Poseidonibacter ostreae]|uniref:GTP cyclohydrolase 1 type 2 homolog n=1 Tax=Poseidonibacter ostreae TaxID=2654171 RepID=A0A6L4WPR0_9BACT|nr:Nif3-like dinuclear metal center hexameric protein [Poseidonibacter ostreae]KAB7885425.1 Nif3-like dinuclear metal center hexameric protein [Poseidonibacter ostreae]KAB7886296.1 Nif3-like dinuclear metal center hexameric protein [Poseidonibacter ostreae]KAB7890040.1 Nif3-like dinuclear metal center hexameric protein [Poseidonibacter ostreae]
MKVKEIYAFLDELSPFELQEKWDNAGLLVGSFDDEVKKVYISIDLDEQLLDEVEENSLIITHHPLIFKGLKRVNYDSYSTKLLQKLIKKDISLISMHTNIDKTHLNKYVVSEVLGLKLENTDEFISYAKVNMKFNDLVKHISKKLDLKTVNTVRCNDFIKDVAIVTGSGMSLIEEVKADCFLTGDIKYHDAMEAKARGISLIDIRHYESERYFSKLLEGLLSEYLKKNELKAIITASKNPFEFFIEGETIE